MKVLLKADVKALGKKNEIVDVSEGYARNFLFPRSLAIEATEGVIRSLQELRINEKKKEEKELAEAKKLAERISSSSVVIARKCGEGGKLFGSVASKDVADAIKEQLKLDLDKRKIELTEPIKALGTYKVSIRLHVGVVAQMDVTVKEVG